MVASIVETSAVVDTYKKHWQECRPCPVSTAEAVWQWHKSLNGAKKKKSTMPLHSVLLPHRMNRIRHSCFLCSQFLTSPLLLLHHTSGMDSQAEKKHYNAATFCSTTALHEQNQTFIPSMFTISDIITAASAPHRMYRITSLTLLIT